MSPKLAAAAWLLMAATPLALQACATREPVAYGPVGEKVPYGYKDRPNPDGGHVLLVVMPPYAALDEARAFWDRRAGELCPGGVAKRIVFRSERKEAFTPAPYVYQSAGVSTRSALAYELEGYVYCKAETPGR